MTVFAIDTTILAVIAFCGWRGYKNGLIRGVFGIVALIVSLIVANIAAEAYSGEFTGMLKPFVSGVIDTAMTEMDEKGIPYDRNAHASEDEVVEYGTAYSILRWIGLPEPTANRISELAAGGDVKGYISDQIGDKLSSALAYVAVFAIAFILISIIFAVIGNLIGVVFSLPGLKLLDTISGTAFGLVKGFILILALTAIVRYFGLLAKGLIEQTKVLSYFVNNNPIADLLGL